MTIKKPVDLAASFVILAGAGMAYREMQLIEVHTVHAMGPTFFPGILIGALAVLALCLALQSVSFGEGKAAGEKTTAVNVTALAMQAAFLGALVLYLVILPYLGYIPSTILFLATGMALLGKRTLKDIALYLLLSAVVAGILYYIFAELLLLFLP